MRKFRQIKTDFTAGELSPRTYGRVDLTDIYPKGARKLKNWIVSPQGGAYYRHGFAFIGTTSSASYVLPRIFTVSRGGVDDDLILELGFAPGNQLLDQFQSLLVRTQFYTVSAANNSTTLLCSWDSGTDVTVPQAVEIPAQGFSFAVMAQAADVLVNPGTGSTLLQTTVPQGTNAIFVWNGSAWGVTQNYVPLTAYARLWSPDTRTAVNLPVPPVTTRDLLFMVETQKGKLMTLVMPDSPPLYLQFNSDWSNATWTQIPQARIPLLQFRDDKSPGAVDFVFDLEFFGSGGSAWTNNDFFGIEVNGIREKRTIFGSGFDASYRFLTDTTQMTAQLLLAIQNNPEVAPDQVTVTHVSGTTYQVTLQEESATANFNAYWSSGPSEKTTTMTLSSAGSDSFEPAWSYPTVVLQAGNYYQAVQPSLNQTPPNATYWTDLGATKPVWFDWQYPSGNAWSATVNYGVGDRGFPRAATFHDQRMVLGGNKDAPLNIWGSKIADYDLFVTGSVNDNDPWAFTLDSMDSPEVQFLTSNKGLFCGSTNGDWIINADVTITPTDIFAARQTARRAALSKPVVLGNEVFYIQNGGTKIRRSAYVRDSDGFRTEDFTLLAEHLFRQPIIQIDKLVSPETFLWALNDQGEIFGCTYDRFAGAQGWHQHETDGVIADITGAFVTLERGIGDPEFSAGIDNLVVIVQRLAEGKYQWFIETMPYPAYRPENGAHTAHNASVHVDSYVEFFHTTAATTSEAKNLGGRDVRLVGIADGETTLRDYGIVSVPADGNIVYPTALIYAAYGLPYTAEGETMEVAYQSGGSTALGTERRWNELWAQTVDSYLPEMKTSETGQYQRQPENPDGSQYVVGEPLPAKITGQTKYYDTGYDRGIIFFRHDRPVPCHITGIYGEVAVNETR